jgi:transposase-like protein
MSYQEVVHAQRYGREFRRAICVRLVAGESITKLANESGVSPAALHRWKDQARIDAGLKPGTKSIEVDQLAQARRTIEELEAELAAVKAAVALFNGVEPVSPECGARLPRV